MQILSENFNVLLVEDNPADLFLLEQMLQASKLKIDNIFTASRLEDAKILLQEQTVHLVLLDLSLPDSFGVSSLKEIEATVHNIPVIILTGLSDSTVALEALNEGAQDYLIKGEFNTGTLFKSIVYSLERKKAEEKILASEEKYKQIFHKNPFPMWINDPESLRILEVNDAAVFKYGYSRKEFLSLTLADIQEFVPIELCLSKANVITTKVCKHNKKNGDVLFVELTYYPINYFGKVAMQAQINDITEKTRLENELNLKKKQLIEAVFNAQETERRKIGEELHDNINQILAAAKLNLTAFGERPEESEGLIKCSVKSIALAMEEIREISKGLIIPGHLRELGLVSSVEYLLEEMLRPAKIQWKLSAEDVEALLSEDHKLAIYRMVQEQLNNIIKHANATFIQVGIAAKGTLIHLSVEDDGCGFDASKRRNGVGMTNIINRAELFNGNVKFKSSPGKGCNMEVTMTMGRKASSDSAFLNSSVAFN